MPSSLRNSLRVSIGESIFNEIASSRSRFYYGIGRPASWSLDTTPPSPEDSVREEFLARSQLLNTKKVTASDVAFVLQRYNWSSGQVYDMFDDMDNLLETKRFYVMSSDFNVYKCLNNNNSKPSTVEPFGINTASLETSDGYTWKYMYTVSPSMQNKFLTASALPVTNSVNDRFYTRGQINAVNILTPGSGYVQDTTTLTVVGDGFQEKNPRRLLSAVISDFGSGYTSVPTVTIDPPFLNTVAFASGASCIIGQIISSGVNYYRVIVGGVLSSTAPTHFRGIVVNGTTQLEFAGTRATSTTTVRATAIGSVFITNQGDGYISAPTVAFSGTGTGATGNVVFSSGKVSSVTMTALGTGYNGASLATFTEPYLSYVNFNTNTAYTLNQVVRVVDGTSTRYYRVTTAGTSGTGSPVHTSGSLQNGTVVFLYLATRAAGSIVLGALNTTQLFGFVGSIRVTNGGTGYLTAPTVAITGGSGSGATATAVIVGGKVTEIIVNARGTNFLTAPTVAITGGSGTGATATAVLEYGHGYKASPNVTISTPTQLNGRNAVISITNEKTEAVITPVISSGQIVGFNIIDPGVGYSFAKINVTGAGSGASLEPILTIGDVTNYQANIEMLAAPLSLSAIKVEEPGANYGSAVITITGDGVGAQAQAVIVNGKLDRVRIINPGSGYTYANLSVVANEGVIPATLRVIMAPVKGHGHNPVRELFAKRISIFSSLSAEKNQGVSVTNDYRQVVLLRNPLKYKSNILASDSLGSACFRAETSYDAGLVIPQDQLVTRSTDGKVFRIVQQSSSVLLLQDMETTTLEVGDTLTYIDSTSVQRNIRVNSVLAPSIDKYSGDLLMINNLQPFFVSDSQSVSIRTQITF